MESLKDTTNSLLESVGLKEPAPTAPPKPVSEPEDWLKADEVEEIKPDEDEKAAEIGRLIRQMMDNNFNAHQHHFRGTHVKTLAIVKGTLTISSSLPDYLQQGIFQPGKSYPVIARYANEPSFLLPDSSRAARGLGLKIFNVDGPRLEDDGGSTQDFLFNNAPMVELTDIDTTVEIVGLRVKYFDNPALLQAAYALRSDRMKQLAPGMLPNNEVVGDTLYTQSSFAIGPYAAHISLLPSSASQEPLKGKGIPSDAGGTYHRDSLRDYYASHAGQYKLRAQFASDLSKHAVEDASTTWDEITAPWHELGTIDFPAQNTIGAARRTWWEDHIALSPWNGLAAHRPLGSINRLRKKVYGMARGHRAEGNATEIKFPVSADEMPE